MANLTKRIIDLQTTSTLGSDDYVMIDGATNGTKKYLLKDILDEIEDVKDGTGLATGAVTTDKLAAGAVTNAKIDDGAVNTTNIADDAVTAAKISDGAVGTDALAANAVTGAKIATSAVGTGNIASGAVTLDKIASDSNATSSRNGLMSSADKAKLDGFSAASNYALKSDIVGAYIFKGSVNTENDLPSTGLTVGDVYNIIAASSYGESGANVAWTGTAWDALGESFDISDGAIDTEQLANGAVTNDKLAEEAMTTVSPAGYIYTDPTYGSEIRQGYEVTFGNSDETIKLPKVNSGGINDLLIDVENIPTIPEKKIGSGAITANKIGAGAVSTEKLANGAVNTDKLATAAVSTDKIASLAVTTNKIAAGAVDNSKLANNAVGTAQIVNGAVTSEKLGSDVTTTINSKAAASDVTALSESIDEELEYKADIDGYYSQLTAGLAENLIGRGDAVPAEYLYRTAGGDADIEDGIATIDCIKGNTLVWNQMVLNGNFESASYWLGRESGISVADGVATVTPNSDGTFRGLMQASNTSIGNSVIGHKYLVSVDFKCNESANLQLSCSGANAVQVTVTAVDAWSHCAVVWVPQVVTALRFYGISPNTLTTSARLQFKNAKLFDLTLMFGAGNEPATVEEFEAMFPLPYYPYSAPKLLPVDIRGIETVGFNLWDEEWESGGYRSETGAKTSHANQIRNSNPIRVLPNMEYYARMGDETYTGSLVVFFYDTGMNYLSNTPSGIRNRAFTTPADCHYINFMIGNNTSPCKTYKGDICINLSWSGYRNGEYEEHWSAERPIDTSRFFPTGLKKVGDKADALYADHYDTVVGAVDLGALTWTRAAETSGHPYFYVSLYGYPSPAVQQAASLPNAFCAIYQRAKFGDLYNDYANVPDGSIGLTNGTANNTVYIKDDATANAAALKTKLSGVMLYYELATPTTTEIDPPLNLSYKVSDFGTERIMVDETADAPQTAPVPMEVEYGLNAIDTIRRLPTNYVPRSEVEQRLDEKADVDGYYAAMTVGAADNLTGRGDGVSGQYLYRTAGGDEDIADGVANIRSIKGQTIVWNQMAKSLTQNNWEVVANSATATYGDGDISITANQRYGRIQQWNVPFIEGHAYLMSLDYKILSAGSYSIYSSTNVQFYTVFDDAMNSGSNSWRHGSQIKVVSAAQAGVSRLIIQDNRESDWDTWSIKNVQLFDLTLMFGEGNEPSTVAEFEALFHKTYYPYSEPTLLSVNMEGIETVGFNLLDIERSEVVNTSEKGGAYVNTATRDLSENQVWVGITMNNYFLPSNIDSYGISNESMSVSPKLAGYGLGFPVKVFPNTEYHLDCGAESNANSVFAVGTYTEDGTYIEFLPSTGIASKSLTFTTPSECRWAMVVLRPPQNTVANCVRPVLNLSWSGYRNGEYEEYWKSQREIPVETYFPDGMRSAGIVHGQNQITRDEITPEKAIVRVAKVVLDGSQENISYFVTTNNNGITVGYPKSADWVAAGFPAVVNRQAVVTCDKLPSMRTLYTSWTGKGISGWGDNSAPIIIAPTGDDSITTSDEFNAWLTQNPLTIYYAMAEPTEVTIEPPLNLSYKVSDFGTEKVMVDEEADAPQSAPPIIQTAYGINATDTVRRLPTQYISHESFQQFVAALQSAVGITVTETWDENDGRYEYTVTQTGE